MLSGFMRRVMWLSEEAWSSCTKLRRRAVVVVRSSSGGNGVPLKDLEDDRLPLPPLDARRWGGGGGGMGLPVELERPLPAPCERRLSPSEREVDMGRSLYSEARAMRAME